MAFDVGSVVAHVKADITNFQQGMKKAQDETGNLKSKIGSAGAAVGDFAEKVSVLSAVAGAGLTLFLKQSSEEASNFQKAMISLDIIAGKFGVSGEKAQKSAAALGKELRIGTGAAAEGLQNLLKSGLNLDQATDLMKRFTNEAITGKSANISLSQAVQNLSFAYATGNSALGNMSGISENFIDITERGREALIKEGKAASEITDEMAKYRGMVDLTNLTLGSSARFTGTLVDKQAQLDQKLTELKITIGNVLNPVLAEMVGFIGSSGLIEGLQQAATNFGEWLKTLEPFGKWIQENKELVMTFVTGLAIGIGALLLVAPLIVLAMHPFILIFAAVAAAIALLYTAWSTNFMGIRDITTVVINGVIDFFNNTLMPFIEIFVTWFTERWTFIQLMIQGVWNIIIGLIQVAWAIVYGIISVGMELLAGDWKGAWERVKQTVSMAWEGIKRIFTGIVQFIIGWGAGLLAELVRPFADAWKKIEEFVKKIKDALDFTKRHSPSVVDIVKSGVRQVNQAMEGLEFNTSLTPHVAASVVGGATGGTSVANVTVDMSGAIISDDLAAMRIGEKIGDSIISKLKLNVRF